MHSARDHAPLPVGCTPSLIIVRLTILTAPPSSLVPSSKKAPAQSTYSRPLVGLAAKVRSLSFRLSMSGCHLQGTKGKASEVSN